jgi:hypothetical protein
MTNESETQKKGKEFMGEKGKEKMSANSLLNK